MELKKGFAKVADPFFLTKEAGDDPVSSYDRYRMKRYTICTNIFFLRKENYSAFLHFDLTGLFVNDFMKSHLNFRIFQGLSYLLQTISRIHGLVFLCSSSLQ